MQIHKNNRLCGQIIPDLNSDTAVSGYRGHWILRTNGMLNSPVVHPQADFTLTLKGLHHLLHRTSEPLYLAQLDILILIYIAVSLSSVKASFYNLSIGQSGCYRKIRKTHTSV